MPNAYAVHVPAYVHPCGRPAPATVIVVAGSTYCPVNPRPISGIEAVAAVAGRFPSIADVPDVTVRESDCERRWCDIPCPELFLPEE